MHSGHIGQRRGLLRPITAGGGGPIFRDLPLFAFLVGLLFFFFIFYIYQAQSAELYDMRNQIELERSRHLKVKSENIDFKAQLEKYKSSEASLKHELKAVRLSQKECSEELVKKDSTLLSYIVNLKQLQNDKNKCFTALDSMKAKLALAKLAVTTLRSNSTSVGSAMEALKETVESFKTQLQGKGAQEGILQETNVTTSSLTITQAANELEGHKNISIQSGKSVDKTKHYPSSNTSSLLQQEAVMPEFVALRVPELIVSTKFKNNYHTSAIISVPQSTARDDQLNFFASPQQLGKQSLEGRNEKNSKLPNIPEVQLNFDNVLSMNGQFPFIQKKDQMKKNVKNDNNNDRKQVIGGEYIDNELEDAN
uniref:Uncharacterized protein n=1 Tax=Elaeophora elaphi TaxID=1147741 RepID=A0A0R3RQ89_9BILA